MLSQDVFKVTLSTFVAMTVILSTDNLVNGLTVGEKDLTFTENEKVALEKLRIKVNNSLSTPTSPKYMKTDLYLIRWLRAKNLNVEQAEAMLMQHLAWRQQNRLDTIQKEEWADMEGDFPYELETHDLEGKPVGTIDVYEWDLRRAILNGRSQRLLRYLYRLLEDVTEQIFNSQTNGTNVTRFVVLGNADGFNLVQHACTLCLPLWIQFVQSFEGHYPGFLDEMIVVESPSTVNVVLDLVKPMLSPETKAALKIFGNNREKWMEYLDGKISRDQRRAAYGGTRRA